MNYHSATYSIENYVPSRFCLLYLSIVLGFLIFTTAPCQAEEQINQRESRLIQAKVLINSNDELLGLSSGETPPLGPMQTEGYSNWAKVENEDELYNDEQNINTNNDEIVAPTKVSEQHYIYGPAGGYGLYSPVYNMQTKLENNLATSGQDESATTSSDSSNNNLFDILESGSGVGDPQGEDSSNSQTTLLHQFNFGGVERSFPNEPPTLTRRIPKLVAVAGRYWRYSIPYDTFFDEVGDLRQLNSSVFFKVIQSNSNNSGAAQSRTTINLSLAGKNINQFFNWLHYDSTRQMLYGFPTEDDAGWHEYLLVVNDLSGLVNFERIEIHVRQHPSTRAFTHQFSINDVSFDLARYPSFIAALKDFVARLSLGVFGDANPNNIIVHSHGMQSLLSLDDLTGNSKLDQATNKRAPNLTLVWSNSSLPIHLCDSEALDELSAKLTLVPQSNLTRLIISQGAYVSAPSQRLIRALEPNFNPSSVTVSLSAACEDQTRVPHNGPANYDSDLKVQTKIGKLDWRLGVPLEFQVPEEVFVADRQNTRNFSLTLHTIDGLTLSESPKYNFLEFDRETQTMFGLPYDMDLHTGQRELLLTAKHPDKNKFVREVFILNVEPQDLTTINNRAFRMSLYFMTRNNLFGPKNRVELSSKLSQALQGSQPEFNRLKTLSEFTVIEVRKFITSGFQSDTLASSYSLNSIQFKEGLLSVVDDFQSNQSEQSQRQLRGSNFDSDATSPPPPPNIYKFTWTNESIGHRGDCPVEELKENILYSLERSMSEFVHRENRPILVQDLSKNDSVRFYERLRTYFEPELDLIHLRFEPFSTCTSALELHDVGNSEIADEIDGTSEYSLASDSRNIETTTTTSNSRANDLREESPINNEEYWSIIVLIVLVAALIFVIMVFFMGMHTYKINQEKKFELQVKLAQARQNSMFLSSLVLSDQAHPNDIVGQLTGGGSGAKPLYVVQDEDGSSRKPVILDNEKQLMAANTNPHFAQFQMHSQYQIGQPPAMYPLRPNMTFTLDSIASSVQNSLNSATATNFGLQDNRRRAMTLNRRTATNSSHQSRVPPSPHNSGSMAQLNHSQSILTVASLATPVHMIPHPINNYPVIYTPLPPVCESNAEMPHEV